jgi:2-polyprenyl-3-methyl-5-hydroxy-6-metoxy-1,4-benzoquinol methylase
MKNRIYYLQAVLLIAMLIHFNILAQEDGDSGNKANQYMNRINIESLVNAFDSPERAEWQRPGKVIALFGDVSNQKIMDLGAGSGYFSLRLAAKGARVIAADVDERFQEIIRKKLENKDLSVLAERVELRKIGYDNPGLEREEVDGILIVDTWHHIDNRNMYIKKALEGVKKGGKIIIVDYKKGVPGGPPENHKLGMEEAMKEFGDINVENIHTDTKMLERQYIIMISK